MKRSTPANPASAVRRARGSCSSSRPRNLTLGGGGGGGAAALAADLVPALGPARLATPAPRVAPGLALLLRLPTPAFRRSSLRAILGDSSRSRSGCATR